jgi:excisionase family DNA binding protein
MPTVRRSAHYTVSEVAEIMQVHPETVRRWIWDGDLKAWMLGRGTGGGYRIDHDELARFVKARNSYLALDLPE